MSPRALRGLFFYIVGCTLLVGAQVQTCTPKEVVMILWMQKYRTEIFLAILGLIVLSVQDHALLSAFAR